MKSIWSIFGLSFLISLLMTIRISFSQSPGMVDESFQSGWWQNSIISDCAMGTDGKFYIGGPFHAFDKSIKNGVAKVNANFTIDNFFDAGAGVNSFLLNEYVQEIAVQPDGKILVCGSFSTFNGVTENDLVRLNTNGSLDLTFNAGTGITFGVGGTSVPTITDIQFQADGKIIIIGMFDTYNGITRNRIARLNTDGSLDLSFDPGSGFDNDVYACAIQADGKIIAAGQFDHYNGNAVKKVCRINTNGIFDNTFNPGSGPNSAVSAVAMQSDGKIIIGGNFTKCNGIKCKALARLNSTGTVDNTFDTHDGAADVRSIHVYPDGKILFTGAFTLYKGVSCHGFIKINSNATVDPSFALDVALTGSIVFDCFVEPDGDIILHGNVFDGDELVKVHPDGTLYPLAKERDGFDGTIFDIASTADGKILAGGSFLTFDRKSTLGPIVKLNTDGSVDAGFTAPSSPEIISSTYRKILPLMDGSILIGTESQIIHCSSTGVFINTFSMSPVVLTDINDLYQQPDGKIIVAGRSATGPTYFPLIRFNISGTEDLTFPVHAFSPAAGDEVEIKDLEVLPDGKYLVIGDFDDYNGIAANGIVRMNTDGSMDATFNSGIGFNAGAVLYQITRTADNKYLVAGIFTSYNGNAVHGLIRLLNNGTYDPTFNTETVIAADAFCNAMQLQDDGTLLAVITHPNLCCNNGSSLIKFMSDGTMDAGFYSGIGTDLMINDIALTADNRIITAGEFTTYDHFVRKGIALLQNPAVCGTPSGLFADNITSTSAKLHWTSVAGATSYKINYRTAGTITWLKKSSTTSFKNITGLTPNTTYEFKVNATCAIGTSAFSSLENFTTLPMRENNPAGSLIIYQDPAAGVIEISMDNIQENAFIIIFDAVGQIMNKLAVSSTPITINISGYPSGLYFISLYSGDNLLTQKFIKN